NAADAGVPKTGTDALIRKGPSPGMAMFRIGIDLGGTKIEAAALDDGGMHRRQRIPTPIGDYAGTIAAIGTLVGRIEGEIGPAASVGIAIPGTIVVETGLVKNANSVWLNGRPLGRDVEAALGRPVRFANDANCFALSEAADGAAAGCGIVFGVILGTGCGGGIVGGGRVLARALAGVINILDPDAIVLGGGLSTMRHLYKDVPRLWGRHIISDAIATRLLPPMHGDSSGVRGAAWLWRPEDLV